MTSAPRIDANAPGEYSGEWPTPTARLGDTETGRGMPSETTAEARFAQGKRNLDDAVAMAPRGTWPTPRAEDCEQTGAHRGVPDTLTSAARKWPTPTAGDEKASGSRTTADSNAHPGVSLTDVAVHGLGISDTAGRQWNTPTTMGGGGSSRSGDRRDEVPSLQGQVRQEWVTPTSRDWKDSPGTVRHDDKGGAMTMPRQVFADLGGQQDPASDNTTGKPPAPHRILNASWVLQLMGYPDTWARLSTRHASRLPETPSSPTSPSASGESS